MSVWESMAMPTCGRPLQSSSIISPSQLWWRARSSVSMVVYPHQLTPWIKSDNSTECRKFLTKDPSAISCGPTPMIAAAGAFLPEVQDTLSVRIFRSSSTMLMDSNWYLVLTSWSWTDTTGLMSEMWSLCSQHQTIATDAVTKQLSWKSMSSWSTPSYSSIQLQDSQNQTLVSVHLTISFE